jgi:hypothetical protein
MQISENRMVSGGTKSEFFAENLLHLNLLFNFGVINLKCVVTPFPHIRISMSALSI